jgi:hypothetical protein
MVPAAEAATLWVLLALAATVLIGYRYGDSNHGITVPLLKKLIDPTLYPGDPLVATGESFPTLFYRVLAWILPSTDWVAPAFFGLYVLTMAATYAAVYRIGCWAGGPGAGALTLLIAFPVRIGLAGEALYRVAFSHSHTASALALWAIVWFLEGRRLLPILVLSLGAYNHALYSAYVLAPLLLVVLAEWRQTGTRRSLLLLAAASLPWLPLLAWGLMHSAPLSSDWLALLRLRSAHHSFPGTFGEDLPGVAALLVLACLAFPALTQEKQRLLAAFLGATTLHFVLGTLFSEFLPVRLVLQYQPHRCWRFVVVLLWAVVSAGVTADFQKGGRARVLVATVGLTLLLPGLAPLLPLAAMLVAFFARPAPPSWVRGLAAAALLGVSGWGLQTVEPLAEVDAIVRRATNDTVMTAAALALLIVAGRQVGGRVRALAVAAVMVFVLVRVGPQTYGSASQRWRADVSPWHDVQRWVRLNTPPAAVVLTPPQEAGFRVFSERAIVGEWKDGTQQYFDDGFALEWNRRMEAVGLDTYAKTSGRDLLGVARRYDASYIVLPRQPVRQGLVLAYRNDAWAVYRAQWREEAGDDATAPNARGLEPTGASGRGGP